MGIWSVWVIIHNLFNCANVKVIGVSVMVARNKSSYPTIIYQYKILIARAIVGGISLDNIARDFGLTKDILEELLLDSSFNAIVLQIRACKLYTIVEELDNDLINTIRVLQGIRDHAVLASDRIRAARELNHMRFDMRQEVSITPRLAAFEGKLSKHDYNTYIDDKLEELTNGITSDKFNELNEKLTLSGV
jgi:hypothetical protein